MAIITPTVGRIVWFYVRLDADPEAAIITRVWSARLVNLCVFAREDGPPRPVSSIPLVQDGDNRPEWSRCEWMPYQKGQAAKTEVAEAALQAKG